MQRSIRIAFLFLILCSYCTVFGETHELGQENKTFTKEKMTIKVGDTVKFVNGDPFFHNIFSLSDAMLFDLGSFPQGEFKSIVFDSAGEVEVECAIHPNMFMTINVE